MLFREVISAYCEDHIKHINTLFGQMQSFLVLKQEVHVATAVNITISIY
jgi:hypothetical protein